MKSSNIIDFEYNMQYNLIAISQLNLFPFIFSCMIVYVFEQSK